MSTQKNINEQLDRLHSEAVIATIYEAITSILDHYSNTDRDLILSYVSRWNENKRNKIS